MSGYISSSKVLFLSNHKCGSTTIDNFFGANYDFTHQRKIGSFNLSPSGDAVNINSKPWKHATIDVWRKYLENKGVRPDSYITITTVRNPWDRLVSLYSYNSAFRTQFGDVSFEEFIDLLHAQRNKAYHPFLFFACDELSRLKVDKVIKLEDLNDSLIDLADELSIPSIPCDVPHENSSSRADYQKYYADFSAEKVYDIFKHEIDLFDYSFN